MNTLVTFNPVTVSPEDSLAKVLRLMEEYEMHHVPVVDHDFRLVGIISDSDVGRCLDDEAGDGDDLPLPSAAALMTSSVTSLDVDMAPLVALQTILERNFHSIPVTSAGRLQGIITATDFLREFGSLAPRAARSPVAKCVSPWRPAIAVDASPAEARRLMEAHQTRFLGANDGLRAVGVLSQRQLRRARRLEVVGCEASTSDDLLLESRSETVGSLLSGGPALLEPMRSLGEAAALMCERRIDGFAVVESGGKIVGMLTETDLLRTLSLELARKA